MMRKLLVAASLLVAPAAGAEEVTLLPGASQKISHSMSASRDTALLGWQLTPHSVLTAGGDVGLFELRGRDLSVRFGYFGMLELESSQAFTTKGKTFGPVLPFQDIHFWRGLSGTSIALSFDRFARRWGGDFEITASYRHESEHFTGAVDGDPPQYQDVPHIGDFAMSDVAARIPIGRWLLEVRAQEKIFLPNDTGKANGSIRCYTLGLGGDVVLRFRARSWMHPFTSTFAEYLFGTRSIQLLDDRVVGVPDDFLVRNITGLAFPGRQGEVQIFLSASVGHGKGLKAFERERLLGGGIRIVPFL